MNIFEQARADIKLLGGPWRLAGFFMEAKIRDGLLGCFKLALLLVVIEDSCHRVQVFRIRMERCAGLVEELAKALGLSQQIEVALDQFRVPERSETLLIHCQTFSHRT